MWIKIKSGSMKLYTGQHKNWTPSIFDDADSSMYGLGIYLTPDISTAKAYSGEEGSVYSVEVTINNPLTPRMRDWQQFIQKSNSTMKHNYLINHGYDAIIDTSGKYKQVMIVDPKQIIKVEELNDMDKN